MHAICTVFSFVFTCNSFYLAKVPKPMFSISLTHAKTCVSIEPQENYILSHFLTLWIFFPTKCSLKNKAEYMRNLNALYLRHNFSFRDWNIIWYSSNAKQSSLCWAPFIVFTIYTARYSLKSNTDCDYAIWTNISQNDLQTRKKYNIRKN